jgi:hypothetical protein
VASGESLSNLKSVKERSFKRYTVKKPPIGDP